MIYLYIKKHRITHKMYFGKTSKDPLKYKGSGFYWLRHLKKHGNDVRTVWYKLFTDQEECTKFALAFSEKHDIVRSNRWLNLAPENGLDGAVYGTKFGPKSLEAKEKISSKLTGKIKSESHRKALSQAHQGLSWSALQREKITSAKLNSRKKSGPQSEESRLKVSMALKGKKQEEVICPHCSKSGGSSLMGRYHFANCKLLLS